MGRVSPVTSHTLRAYLAAEHRKTERDPDRIAEIREQLREAQLVEWLQRFLAAEPPVSQETRARLAALLRGQPAEPAAP